MGECAVATITVTASNDIMDANDNVTSLREALTLASGSAGADTIVFATALAGSTVTLAGVLVLASDVTITGDTIGYCDITGNKTAS
jgi:hypothetical protein